MNAEPAIEEQIGQKSIGRTDTSLTVLPSQSVPERAVLRASPGTEERTHELPPHEPILEEIIEDDISLEISNELDDAFAFLPRALKPASQTESYDMLLEITDRLTGTVIKRLIQVRGSLATAVLLSGVPDGRLNCTVTIEKDILLLILSGQLEPGFALLTGALKTDSLPELKRFTELFHFDREQFDAYRASLRHPQHRAGPESTESVVAPTSSADLRPSHARPSVVERTGRYLSHLRDQIMGSDSVRRFTAEMERTGRTAHGLSDRLWSFWGFLMANVKRFFSTSMSPTERSRAEEERRRLQGKLDELKQRREQLSHEKEQRRLAAGSGSGSGAPAAGHAPDTRVSSAACSIQ